MKDIEWQGFVVPSERKMDGPWLLRNLVIRNADHPRLGEVLKVIKADVRLQRKRKF